MPPLPLRFSRARTSRRKRESALNSELQGGTDSRHCICQPPQTQGIMKHGREPRLAGNNTPSVHGLRIAACALCRAAGDELASSRLRAYRRRCHRTEGQKALLGAWGGRAGSSRGEGERRSPSRSRPRSPQRRRRGRPALAGRSFPRRHFIQAEPRPGARAAEPQPQPQPPPRPPRSLSCFSRRGWGICGQGPPEAREDATWRAGLDAQLHHVGRAPQEPPAGAPPADSPAGRGPGNLRAPAGQGPAVPFPLGKVSDSSPSARGRRPQRGSGSSDYLIAADTKPIFFLFKFFRLSPTFALQDQLQGAPGPLFCCPDSRPEEERSAWPHADSGRSRSSTLRLCCTFLLPSCFSSTTLQHLAHQHWR